jgi:hypothetical protein
MRRTRGPARRAVLCSVVFALWTGASAAPDTRPAPARPEVMSRFELRQCMDRQEALDRRQKVLDAEQALLDSEASALAEEARLLAGQLRFLDQKDARVLENYDRQRVSHNESVKRYNAANESINADLEALNSDTAAVMKTCATRLFSKDDQEAILAERRTRPTAVPPN